MPSFQKPSNLQRYRLLVTKVYQRLNNPHFLASASLFVSTISCLLLFWLLMNRSSTQSIDLKQANLAFKEANSLLEKRDFSRAYDMVMVASRLAPSDKRIIDIVISFIEKASKSGNEEAVDMADELAERGDSLVLFQNPENVASSRERLNNILKARPEPESKGEADPTSVIDKVLKVAENPKIALSLRTKAAETARNAINDMALDQALTGENQQEKTTSSDLGKLINRVDAAEKLCLTSLFEESNAKATIWYSELSDMIKKIDTIPPEQILATYDDLTALSNKGIELLQEIMAYTKTGVTAAKKTTEKIENDLKLLQKTKDWIYNKYTLIIVREIEDKKELKDLPALLKLADVNEELLSSYVLRRHNTLWDKIFENLSDDEARISALKARILKNKDN